MSVAQLTNSQRAYWIGLTAFVIIFLLYAISLRAIFLVHPVTIDNNDSRWHYDPLARNLLQGHGYTKSLEPPYIPDSFHQPGYALFLAATYAISGYSLQFVGYIQTLLEASIICMIWQLGGWLGLSKRARVAAVAFALATPLLARFSREVLTETLATFTMTLTVLLAGLAVKKSQVAWGWILTGIAGGSALLVRADLLPSIILLIVMVTMLSHQRHKVILLIVALLVTMSPWMIRNFTIYGQLKPLGEVTTQAQLPYVRWLNTWLTDYTEEREYWHQRDPDPTVDYDQLARIARQEAPARTFIWIPILRTVRVWINQPLNLPTPWYWQPVHLITYLTLAFGLVGVVLMFWKRQWLLLIPFAIVVGRSVLPFMSALGVEPRYMLEAIPMVYLLGGYGYDMLNAIVSQIKADKNAVDR